jgi:hypothetical protein
MLRRTDVRVWWGVIFARRDLHVRIMKSLGGLIVGIGAWIHRYVVRVYYIHRSARNS